MPNQLSLDAGAQHRAIRKARLRLLQMHYESRVGHIGGNLSSLDATLFLHQHVLSDDDVFVLSKGHSIGALYVTLWMMRELSDEDLATFHADGTKLAGHPVPGWTPRIPAATGSLGHGLPFACGIAMAKRTPDRSGRVFCLTSDGEWQEGANWEALIFAKHHDLNNLTILVDANGLQGFGSTGDVASMQDLPERIRGFGIPTVELDGHDPTALENALCPPTSQLRVLVMHTIKGKGVSFMENEMKWHYLPLDDDLYRRAVEEVQADEG